MKTKANIYLWETSVNRVHGGWGMSEVRAKIGRSVEQRLGRKPGGECVDTASCGLQIDNFAIHHSDNYFPIITTQLHYK